jgi:hypothetical protein
MIFLQNYCISLVHAVWGCGGFLMGCRLSESVRLHGDIMQEGSHLCTCHHGNYHSCYTVT